MELMRARMPGRTVSSKLDGFATTAIPSAGDETRQYPSPA
jgi:hypothetical protein